MINEFIMTGTGIIIIVIILVPILFQIVLQGIESKKRFKEIKDRLKAIEDKLNRTEK